MTYVFGSNDRIPETPHPEWALVNYVERECNSNVSQLLGRVAHGAIGIGNQQLTRLGVVHIGYIFLIHVPGFCGGMPRDVELVIPGEIKALQVVVERTYTVERVQAAVEIVLPLLQV